MVANYDAEVAAHRLVVIVVDGTVTGYLVYFIDNIGVEPKCQGPGLRWRMIAAAEA